ncbi:glyoxalase/bleomycin resistance protein/dioxygenase [Janthinobacterium sp. HH01]|uniref:VOC family protein n=1 Tax=Janthinobacterium sp. HH01 TaxID=1198452 RepID=UPI0002AE8BC3|nr:VOC family protein [Janthinobacterium sp. HH01]ELX10122.1 glyoxalase/bleomycin resistance protein/dioxygenase [Janthinobacterium sp. HH01]
MTAKVDAIPKDMHSVTPHLVVDGAAAAIEFYKKAFNAVETARMPGPEGKIMHAAVRIGDSQVMLVDEFPDFGNLGPLKLKGSPVTLHIYVTDADATYAQAIDAGATSRMPPADMFWGDRYGQVTDPFGHVWSIATHVKDMTPEEMAEAMKQQTPHCG